jgi:predicted GNAT family acetyltransferase
MRDEGRSHAILFAIKPEAQKAYRAIGFERIGDWMFDILIKPCKRL